MPLKRTTSLKKVLFKRKIGNLSTKPRKPLKKAKRKPKKVDLLREYGVPVTTRLRYTGLRGILWYWFSKYIRERDKDLNCINCDLPKEERHAGHFIPTGKCGWDGMVFAEKNVNSECSSCNMRDKRKLKYAINLDKKYGRGTVQLLQDNYEMYLKGYAKNWPRDLYRAKIAEYKELLEALQTV